MAKYAVMFGLGSVALAMSGKFLVRALKGAKNKTATDVFSNKANVYKGPFDGKMSRREAALILGVRETANVKQIQQSHRRLMLLNHPDNGGSTFLATKINEAKDVLLTR